MLSQKKSFVNEFIKKYNMLFLFFCLKGSLDSSSLFGKNNNAKQKSKLNELAFLLGGDE